MVGSFNRYVHRISHPLVWDDHREHETPGISIQEQLTNNTLLRINNAWPSPPEWRAGREIPPYGLQQREYHDMVYGNEWIIATRYTATGISRHGLRRRGLQPRLGYCALSGLGCGERGCGERGILHMHRIAPLQG